MKHIVILVFDGVEALDVIGPSSVFAAANACRPHAYSLSLATTESGQYVRSSSGVSLGPAKCISDIDIEIDTLLVAGGSEAAIQAAIASGLPTDLHAVSQSVRRLGSVCTGAFLLGAAGLLSGRRATTHWRAARQLQSMFPDCKVNSDRIFEIDGIYTSAGVTAGIDLALQLVSEDFGDRLAMAIARELVVPLRRSGGQLQFSASLAAQANASSALQGLIAWMNDNPTEDLSVYQLAKRSGMSERNFARKFVAETGSTPASFVTFLRLDCAKRYLESTDYPLARIAERSGFGSVDALERRFRKRLGITPNQFRERFRV